MRNQVSERQDVIKTSGPITKSKPMKLEKTLRRRGAVRTSAESIASGFKSVAGEVISFV